LEYCSVSELLENGDELAIIPPVSGGEKWKTITINLILNSQMKN
jgi:hypothetical protein